MATQNSFKKGLKDGVPICLGYFSVSFAYGIFAVENGLSNWQAVAISLLNLTSAGQLAGVPIITGGGTLAELALSQLVINSRYSLMSVSLAQKFSPSVKLRDKLIIAYANTDENFAMAVSNKEDVGKNYMFGLILLPIIGWTSGTLIGAVAGNILPLIVTAALGLAIYGMFVAIVVPVIKKEKTTFLCVIFSIILSCLFKYLPLLQKVPSGFTVIICAVVASAVFAIIAPIKTDETEEAQENG